MHTKQDLELGDSFWKIRSANYDKLMDMLNRISTNTEEAMIQLKNERARQTFFSAYFNCLRHQASLKLKAFGVVAR